MSSTNQLSPTEVGVALLQHNYFPNHMHDGKEVPPIFSSLSVTHAVLEKLTDKQEFPYATRDKAEGFDAVSYRLTRFNLLHRNLGVPHPLAYARLVNVVLEHWEDISYVTHSRNSQFPIAIQNDGRISSMKYDTPETAQKKQRPVRQPANVPADGWQDVHAIRSQGKRYKVLTDIANFHPSIYTHSISWAAVGIPTAKANTRDSKAWYNKLDKALRHCKRNETVGLWTGPGTSTIAAEMILVKVDEKLATEHLRYVDDYVHYTQTHDEAERFLKNLGSELAKYGLHLNPAKTSIVQLPAPVRPSWLRSLNQSRPKSQSDIQDILDYLDTALDFAAEDLQESAVKFAVHRVVEAIESKNNFDACITRLLNLCAFFPNISAPVVELCLKFRLDSNSATKQVNMAISTHLNGRYSDGASWLLYLAFLENMTLHSTTIDAVIQSDDVFAMTLLACAWPTVAPAVLKAASDRTATIFDVDSRWLFWYELYQRNLISDNPYAKFGDTARHRAHCFDVLKDEKVCFVDTHIRATLQIRRALGIQA